MLRDKGREQAKAYQKMCNNVVMLLFKRDAGESMSSLRQKINALQADLAALEHKHKMQKLCRTACEQALKNSSGGDPDTTLQYRERRLRASLSNCANIFCSHVG